MKGNYYVFFEISAHFSLIKLSCQNVVNGTGWNRGRSLSPLKISPLFFL